MLWLKRACLVAVAACSLVSSACSDRAAVASGGPLPAGGGTGGTDPSGVLPGAGSGGAGGAILPADDVPVDFFRDRGDPRNSISSRTSPS